ncbi:K(+)-transporting ATPase subunit C [Aetokthonos hydrillicola Thurmond2011]|jgi:K+-transporting ATPase ATPase C chain|uniref:Potassium-transporting ATPase KdpC subunit n=1 Tax=Aetokthonos hydrillicola Thurmond2011 TaxID=2712845 RepID=A0AAP5MDE6_9CYAN|nr:K(+)-transporting ATPase subunit C [Aetokthonos hydrillicola]MBO3461321.1 K(+)-transporting ATPase subunit C [Aetokthonos hydrillicola CCALA 1050]MBW4589282.1 K(+)-transporting ATPase subunit C [Aetokthonos hydrillicola CCALA 1050]MDR9900467.1 K(+)-transporting ATPase subunit C [Aetokthonos hydrillicola Thurmond2011]
MLIFKEATRAVRITLILWVITAIIYPLLILIVGQAPILKDKANGSIMHNIQGQPIGSTLIGQQFRSKRYFHSRPSTVKYSQGKEAKSTGLSGASNLAPSNPKLLKRIEETVTQLTDASIQPVADLLYTSGSGLDPHISVKAAQAQLSRVAKARNVRPDEILPLIYKYTEDRFLKIFGEPGVNVLKLNYALDLDEFNRKQDQ